MLFRVKRDKARYGLLRPDNWPELGMGVQLLRFDAGGGERLGLLLAGMVAVPIDDEEEMDEGLSEIFIRQREWAFHGKEAIARGPFDRWFSELKEIDRIFGVNTTEDVARLIPNHQMEMPSPVVGVPYGHLPFRARTGVNEVFYRFEVLPMSTWIVQATGEISAGTYAAPASEMPFVPTGFAAVGRYALPRLPPYCWRWELQPMAGTEIDVGASVPLHGQAGGGVEVRFRDPTHNNGPIANPIKLPAY